MESSQKFIVFCAPSGAGKTSVKNGVMARFPQLAFSISAATRNPRGQEKDGVDYYFNSSEQFQQKINNNEFVEWEMVYEGKYYGTLKSEIDRLHSLGKIPVLDIDVKGAKHVVDVYGDNVLPIFVKAPPQEVEGRLKKRATDSPEDIADRLARMPEEMTYEKYFKAVNNIDLAQAIDDASEMISNFLKA